MKAHNFTFSAANLLEKLQALARTEHANYQFTLIENKEPQKWQLHVEHGEAMIEIRVQLLESGILRVKDNPHAHGPMQECLRLCTHVYCWLEDLDQAAKCSS